ncbi:MAG: hypothetical protein H7X71_00050, partial [Chitinophagales bacterium]|nr:hypothetical protein [Chitinophagales bacterium]
MHKLNFFLLLLCIHTFVFSQNFEWAKQMGASGSQSAQAVISDINGNVYTTGWYRGTVDFDPGPGIFNLPCNPESGSDYVENDMFISKLDSLGNFVWAKRISGDGMQNGLFMALDAEQNLYITGHYSHTVDFDPGPATFYLTSANDGDDYSWDMFLMKLDNAGNFIWALEVGGISTGGQSGEKIVLDEDANIYVAGRYNADADFDPGPGVAILECEGIWDVFVAKYDTDGSYVWAKQLGGTGHELCYSLARDEDGNIITTGHFYGTGDYDPGPDEVILTADGTSDFEIFISKLDSDGNFIWVDHLIGDNDAASHSVITNENDIILFCDFNGTIDADPNAGVTELTSAGEKDIMVARYAADGALLWAKSIGGIESDLPYEGVIDAAGDIYFTGYFYNTVDFDPGPGIFNLTADFADIFICKLDQDGNFIWALRIGDDEADYGLGMYVDDLWNIYVTGQFDNTVDFDPGLGYFPLTCTYDDIYVLKLSQDFCDSLTLIADTIADVTCDGVPALLGGHADGGQLPYSYVWSTAPITYDSVATTPVGGFMQFNVTDALGCERSSNYLVNGPATVEGFDLKTNLVMDDILYGFESNIWLDAFNNGCEAATGHVDVVLDNKIDLVSADPVPDLIIGDTLRWTFSDMVYGDPHITSQLVVTTSDEADLGDTVIVHNKIQPLVDDMFPENNIKYYFVPVTGSYDPNDKSVYPTGICEPGYILNSDTLTYTIRFQNTGTADAINIYILDTLSQYLDINSIVIDAASHNMITQQLEGNVIKFMFTDIYLPDSTTNEPESHGYVIFEVLPAPGLSNGTEIINSSAIYFDFNDPVITNAVLNTIIDEIPIYEVEQTVSICAGENIFVGDSVYYAAGIYTNVLNSLAGCDSTVITHLFVNPINTEAQAFEICNGDSISVGEHTYTTSGIYTDVWINAFGCDSTIITTLTVNPVYDETLFAEICDGDSISVGEHIYNTSGIYTDVLINAFGCDSTITTTLTVNPVY